MNTSLQKDIITPTERIERSRSRSKKYMTRHKTMCVTLSKENDNDILDWLGEQENRSEAVREALKKMIKEQKMRKAFKLEITPKGTTIWEEE